QRVDLNDVRLPQIRVPAAPQRHSLPRSLKVRASAAGKPTQIVEPKLRRRIGAKRSLALRAQIAQHPIAKPMATNPAQLLLDPLERTPKRRAPSKRLPNINIPRIQPHRIKAGEPPHRARQINLAKNLLTTVTLKRQPNRRAAIPSSAPPTPLHNRKHKP